MAKQTEEKNTSNGNPKEKAPILDDKVIKKSSRFEFSNNIVVRGLIVLTTLFVFLVSLQLMGDAFKLFGKDVAHDIINATSNPFVGLFIGLLATAIIQSSSTTTSMVVAMVGSGVLTLEGAVPLIMGANIGTSVTSTIVSMGHIGSKKEFRKAISAATVHDFFNIMIVLMLFPLEYFFGFLSTMASSLAGFLTVDGDGQGMFNIMKYTVKPTSGLILDLINQSAIIALILGVVLLILSLSNLTRILKKLLIGKAQERMDSILFKKPLKAMGWGTLLTAAVQSSSVTSSLVVPLVATNKVSLRKAFPFLIGANIGTTVTALIASLSKTEAALAIALAHVFFNVFGATIVFPIKALRDIPIRSSRWLGKATLKNRMVGFAYVIVVFFFIPGLLILFTRDKTVIKEYTYETIYKKPDRNYYKIIVEQNERGMNLWKVYDKLDKNDTKALPEKPDHRFYVEKKSNVIFYGDQVHFLRKKGFCWDDEDPNGKYEVCVDKVIDTYKHTSGYKVHDCTVFRKTYYQDSTYFIYYFNPEDLQIFKTTRYSKGGKVLYSEKLVEVD